MSKRKKLLIDKKFQLKTAFTILGLKIVVVAFLIAIVGIYALYQSKKISNIVEIEDNIVQVLSLPTIGEVQQADGEEDVPEQEYTTPTMSLQMAQNHDQNMKQLRKMININQMLIWGIVVIVLIQGVIIFFLLIRYTHRIAGPLYVMTMYMRMIINGNFPEHVRPLRDRDLLKGFYTVFSEMVETLKSRSCK
jgi:uncharacterized membrane protein YidH (DUF202 family)